MSEDNDWEWDRERIGVIVLIAMIIIGVSALVVMIMPDSRARTVSYILTESRDTDQINLVYRTFFGHIRYFDNASLVTVKLQIADIPDVSQVMISVYMTLPTNLVAIVISDYPAESNVLHGQDDISEDQLNYVVTLNVGQRNLIVYMFFEDVYEGSFEFAVNLFQA